MWTASTTSDDHRVPEGQWPRWHGADERGVLTIRANSLITPERAAAVLWRYGRWLDHLARHGGVFLRSQWQEGYGGGENGADRAWSDCLTWGVVQEQPLDGDSRRGARLGWLTRAGWYLVARYGVPADRHAPALAACRTIHALCWLEHAQEASEPLERRPAPTAFLTKACAECGVPEPVARSLARDGALLGRRPADLTQGGRLAFSVGPWRGGTALFAADAAAERGERTTVRWLANLRAVRSIWPGPWRDTPLAVLCPGDQRARWWAARRRLWAANGWPDGDLLAIDTGLEERHGVVLVH